MLEDQKHQVGSSRKELGPKSWPGYVRQEPRLKNKQKNKTKQNECVKLRV